MERFAVYLKFRVFSREIISEWCRQKNHASDWKCI